MDYEDNNNNNQEDIPVINTDTGLLRTLEGKLGGLIILSTASGFLAPIVVYELFQGKYKTAFGLALFDVCAMIGTNFLKDEISEKYTRR